jgi:hypothetical protein
MRSALGSPVRVLPFPWPSLSSHSRAHQSPSFSFQLISLDSSDATVTGYPDCHPDSPTPADDIAFLKEKIDAGADFVITQLFYDVEMFLNWHKRCREAGKSLVFSIVDEVPVTALIPRSALICFVPDPGITVPIIPGVMPIQNFSSFRRMTNLCKANVPQPILDELEPIKVGRPMPFFPGLLKWLLCKLDSLTASLHSFPERRHPRQAVRHQARDLDGLRACLESQG